MMVNRWTVFWLAIACTWGGVFPSLASKDLLQAGPMVGHVDIVEATLWVQTSQACNVAIRYQGPDGTVYTSKTLPSEENHHFTTLHLLSGLTENTSYSYQVLINGKAVARDYPQTFKTQMHWKYRTKPPEFKFAFGSCLFVNDAPYDRPGTPYGDRFDIFEKLRETKPDFMIWLGDNTYFRESDFTPARMNYRHAHTRALPELQPFLASTSHYAIWDDHDYGPDNSDRSYAFKGEALELFKRYWANLSYGLPEAPGVFSTTSYSDVDFFYMDDRYYRAPNRLRDTQKPYWGAQQLQWLKDALVNSRATFKIIVNGNQVHNSNTRFESFVHYQAEYRDFIDWLHLSAIEGILFLSGDRHHTELLKIDRPGAYPLYEFTSSPLTSGTPRAFTWEAENPLRVEGTLVWDQRNFGVIEVLGEGRSRRLLLRCIDADGSLRWEKTIPKQDLQFPQAATENE